MEVWANRASHLRLRRTSNRAVSSRRFRRYLDCCCCCSSSSSSSSFRLHYSKRAPRVVALSRSSKLLPILNRLLLFSSVESRLLRTFFLLLLLCCCYCSWYYYFRSSYRPHSPPRPRRSPTRESIDCLQFSWTLRQLSLLPRSTTSRCFRSSTSAHPRRSARSPTRAAPTIVVNSSSPLSLPPLFFQNLLFSPPDLFPPDPKKMRLLLPYSSLFCSLSSR